MAKSRTLTILDSLQIVIQLHRKLGPSGTGQQNRIHMYSRELCLNLVFSGFEGVRHAWQM